MPSSVDNVFEVWDSGMHLVVRRTPTVHVMLYNEAEQRTYHFSLDKAEAQFLGQFLLGEDA